MLVALMNATIDFVQQYKTATILESFKKLAPTKAMVVRESHLTTIDATMVVPGDVVFIQAGDRVPGDVRLFSNNDLRLDNSSITGEGEPLERDLAMASVINPFEATNLAFGGTNITNGEGFGIVIRTGDHTTIGQIARLAVGEKTPRSQLNDEIDLFVKRIAAVAVVVAAVFFTAGLLLGCSIGVTFSFAIWIFVAFVPQGLPLTVSVRLRALFFNHSDVIDHCCESHGQTQCSREKSPCGRNLRCNYTARYGQDWDINSEQDGGHRIVA